jgi:hypothetical protein
VVDVDEELIHMGEFLLTMAVERAVEQGVTAEPIIRTGVIREALPEVSRELGASFIVLGRPAGESSRFQESEFEKFSEWLQNETDATIVVYEEPVES